MEIRQRASVPRPVEEVWAFLADIEAVVDCIPGASLAERIGDNRYRGAFKAKLGPVSTQLEGEGALERDDASRVGTVTGKGVDKRGGSRVTATMTYAVRAQGSDTAIEIRSDVKLSGRLAQVGRTGIVETVAARLTEDFAANLRERLTADPGGATGTETGPAAGTPPPPGDALDVGGIAARSLRARFAGWLRRLLRLGP